MKGVFIRFAELSLKRKKQPFFLSQLVNHLKKLTSEKIKLYHQGIFIPDEKIKEKLKFVPGISWYAKVILVEPKLEIIKEEIKKILLDQKPTSFKVNAKRKNKAFSLSSTEIKRILGKALEKETQIKGELNQPQLEIFVEIAKEFALIYTEKIRGLGGLPAGSIGRALVLFSGGIDSPVAAILMIKRGLVVDLLHFHTFADSKKIEETKIFALCKLIAQYQIKTRLYLASYLSFYLKIIEMKEDFELVLFRRFMITVAQKLAEKIGAKAIVSGDSLGQVASQTIENLAAVDQKINFPILRPLIGFNKEEIINLAKDFGSYSLSIQPYKDCCSIFARHPKPYKNIKEVETIEEKLHIEEAVEENLKKIVVYKF